jgi:hypothetical protein
MSLLLLFNSSRVIREESSYSSYGSAQPGYAIEDKYILIAQKEDDLLLCIIETILTKL